MPDLADKLRSPVTTRKAVAATPCFLPGRATISHSQMTLFMRHIGRICGVKFADTEAFYQFTVRNKDLFWRTLLAWSALPVTGEAEPVCVGDEVETASFFPNLSLNYAECLLAGEDAALAVIACHAGRPATRLTRGALRQRVQRAAAGLASLGVGPGCCVAAIAHNDADAVVACLAAAALGACFSAAAPGMGAQAILSRFGQLSPLVLLAHTEQQPGDRLADALPEIVAGLPSLRAVVTLGEATALPIEDVPVYRLSDLVARSQPLREWPQFPFNHPLFILFSSGTTGLPKCIMHGAGGTLLEHVKEHRLHTGLRSGDRLFFQTSSAWMMWNWQLSALAGGVSLVLYDGPVDSPAALWSIVAEHAVDVFGTSAAYLKMCESLGYVPANKLALGKLRAVLSTGAVLADSQYDWVLQNVKRLPLQSISGGSDIIGCFVLGNPNLAVYRGEAQCRSLALDVAALDALPGEVGELVCRNPFPSRPLGFFGDPTGQRFHAAYFSQNPGIWTHGDRIAITPRGTARMHGRSDGTLNVRGVRIGTADVYAALQDVPELVDAMAVEQAMPDTAAGSRMILLVVLRPGIRLNSDLILRLRRQITRRIGANYVPGVIADVAELPTTHSGKPSEAAAGDAINGRPVRNRDALRNPGSLDVIASHPVLAGGSTTSPADAEDGKTTEEVLRAIWAEAFGVDTIGTDDDFFALGGDSLMAVTICTQIGQAFGYEIPLGTLFQANTVAALARVLDGGVAWQGHSPLIPVKNGTGAPVFLLHSIAGNLFEWQPLLHRLDCARPILALQARGLNPDETPPRSTEAMAADYVALIRARQPHGPYTLLGYSYGGLLAYEIAVRLHSTGEAVAFLGMIDTHVHPRMLPVPAQLRFHLRQFRLLCRRVPALRLAGTVQLVSRIMQNRLGRPAGRSLATANTQRASLPPILRRVRTACLQAFAAYDPPSYPGEITFFRCPELRPQYCDPLIVLRPRAGSLRIVEATGDHLTMMQEPNVGQLADQIARCLSSNTAPGRSITDYEIGENQTDHDLSESVSVATS